VRPEWISPMGVPRPKPLTVLMDRSAAPIRVIREHHAATVIAAHERDDLEELHYGGENARVWDVTLEGGEELTLVRSLGSRGWFLLQAPAAPTPLWGRSGLRP
jgi:hypothetical protein